MKPILILFSLFCSLTTFSQITSNKSGDIEFNNNEIATIEKHKGGSKFSLINNKKDTLINITHKKDLDYHWFLFDFLKQNTKFESDNRDLILVLNYKKSIANFIVINNLIDSTGNLNLEALGIAAKTHKENLTEKYIKLNEPKRAAAAAFAAITFNYTCNDGKIFINEKHVGYATVPDNQQVTITGVVFKDLENNIVASGETGFFGGAFKTNTNQTLKINVTGKTTDCTEKTKVIKAILVELYKNGYYK